MKFWKILIPCLFIAPASCVSVHFMSQKKLEINYNNDQIDFSSSIDRSMDNGHQDFTTKNVAKYTAIGYAKEILKKQVKISIKETIITIIEELTY